MPVYDMKSVQEECERLLAKLRADPVESLSAGRRNDDERTLAKR